MAEESRANEEGGRDAWGSTGALQWRDEQRKKRGLSETDTRTLGGERTGEGVRGETERRRAREDVAGGQGIRRWRNDEGCDTTEGFNLPPPSIASSSSPPPASTRRKKAHTVAHSRAHPPPPLRRSHRRSTLSWRTGDSRGLSHTTLPTHTPPLSLSSLRFPPSRLPLFHPCAYPILHSCDGAVL